jgi:hypothetical protein
MNHPDETRFQLYGAWNRNLYLWWDYYNHLYLREALKRPVIRLMPLAGALGKWDAAARTLTLSLSHIEQDDWFAVMDTLRHEMAHQYVDEVLGPVNETAHGRAFQEAGRKLRCGHKASERVPPPAEEERALRRLKKVLSLAASPNEHEARRAVQKARELMLKYNLDRVEADRERDFSCLALGPVKARHTAAELRMASLLGRFFFVEVLWQHTYDARRDRAGTVLTVYGTPPNLDMAHYVYDFLWTVMGSLWARYRESRRLPDQRQRQRYFAGVLDGFYRKLEGQDRALRGTRALVWRGDPRLTAYFRYLNPRVRTSYGAGVTAGESYRAGVDDGRRVNLHRPIEQAASSHGGYITGG